MTKLDGQEDYFGKVTNKVPAMIRVTVNKTPEGLKSPAAWHVPFIGKDIEVYQHPYLEDYYVLYEDFGHPFSLPVIEKKYCTKSEDNGRLDNKK